MALKGREPSGTGSAPLDPDQRAIRTLARRILKTPAVEVEGDLCRAVAEKYLRRDPPEPLYYWGSLDGARYTPRGGPAGLYLARDPVTALAEIRVLLRGGRGRKFSSGRHDPVTVVSVYAKVGQVLDLTDGDVRRVLRISKKAIRTEWQAPMLAYLSGRGPMPLTQQIGLAAHVTGRIAGILYPSAREEDGVCLVVFPDRLAPGDRVEAHDSTGTLAQVL